jgi:hypothetical protein
MTGLKTLFPRKRESPADARHYPTPLLRPHAPPCVWGLPPLASALRSPAPLRDGKEWTCGLCPLATLRWGDNDRELRKRFCRGKDHLPVDAYGRMQRRTAYALGHARRAPKKIPRNLISVPAHHFPQALIPRVLRGDHEVTVSPFFCHSRAGGNRAPKIS